MSGTCNIVTASTGKPPYYRGCQLTPFGAPGWRLDRLPELSIVVPVWDNAAFASDEVVVCRPRCARTADKISSMSSARSLPMYARSLSSSVAGLVVAVSCLGALAADDPVLLSWKFKKGDQRHYVAEQKTSTEGKLPTPSKGPKRKRVSKLIKLA